MAFTKIAAAGIETSSNLVINNINTAGVITAASIVATTGTFTGNVSVAGTITYEDVTNIDSVGIVTARSSVIVGAGLSVVGVTTLASAGGITTTGGTLFTKQLNVSGVSTFGNTVVVGGATTQLIVNGNARITGILTVGASSLTFDGNANTITGLSTITGSTNYSKPNLSGISSTISSTAVDIFVYDTRKDSDGGQWRKRTQHTSWYNETLNTATRGSRRDFPAVAVIVATDTTITIYDGDDPDMPMWMVFNLGYETYIGMINGLKSVAMFNGIMSHCGIYDLHVTNFISDKTNRYGDSSGITVNHKQPISGRNDNTSGNYNGPTTPNIVDRTGNDLAMTVLPNAPIDSATGLPVPTIAVATNGGVSVIRDDGTVVNLIRGGNEPVSNLQFNSEQLIIQNSTTAGTYYNVNIPSSSITNVDYTGSVFWTGGTPAARANYGASQILSTKSYEFVRGYNTGFDILTNYNLSTSGLVAYASTSYNTGWMHGDIKGAWLSDTSTTSVTGTITYSDSFDNNNNGWTFADNGSSGISGGVMTIEQNGSARATDLDALNGVATGTKLSVTFTIATGGTGTLRLDDDGSGAGAGGTTIILDITSTGTFSAIYTKTASNRLRFIRNSGSGNYTISEITIKPLVEADRSVNNNGLAVYGTITKSAVATGSNLVAYSGFGASNGLIQPYNSALDFGTGDYYMSIWAYGGETNQVLMIREEASSDSNGSILIFQYNGYYAFYSRTSGTPTWTTFLSTAPYGNYWSHIYLVRRSGVLQGYVNGNLVGSTAFSGTVTNTIAQVSIGKRVPGVNTQYFTGSLALAKIGSGAPSPIQIAKIYNDEKALFQPNSQCTLFGSSDAVTALAYDDTTKLLSVGTSSGRSDFQGLERINNTTTAVTTAISASNGLIAEQ